MSHIDTVKLNKIEAAYNSLPSWYDVRGFFILTFSYNCSLVSQITFFSQNCGGFHLEAAIGTGTLVKLIMLWRRWILRDRSFEGVGFDYSPQMLAGARQKISQNNFKLILADASHLDFQDETFDTINLANSFHCLPEMKNSMRELCRVLKKDGSLYLNILLNPDETTFLGRLAKNLNDWGMRKGILVCAYDERDALDSLSEIGFKIAKNSRRGNSLNVILKK